MKQNLILGAIASILATGSALATLAPETAWIRAKTSASQSTFTCQQTSVQCDNIGASVCLVQVNTTINGGTKVVNGRRGPACIPVLTCSDIVPMPAPDTFYDAQ